MLALICEDDAATRSLIEAVMQRAGFEVEATSNGADALSRLMECEFDVVVLDLMIPGLSGSDLLQRLRNDRPRLLSRVVVTTAAVSHANAKDLSGEVGAIITKPFDIMHLTSTVLRVSGRDA